MRTALVMGGVALLTTLQSPAIAGDWRVEGASLPIPFLSAPPMPGAKATIDARIEASAVEAIGDGRLLLVAHDKGTELYVVEAKTGRIVGRPLTCDRFPNGAEIAPKWEGLARDDAGWYYVVGTHSGATDAERAARSFLFRFRLTGGPGDDPVAIDGVSVRRWHIAGPLREALARQAPDEERLGSRKIEGLTVRAIAPAAGRPGRTELIIGLREPGDLVRTFATDITTAPEEGATLALDPLFSFDAGTCEGVPSQLTSLQHAPALGGFLVVTAAEDAENAFHGNTLWFLPDAGLTPGTQAHPQSVYVFEPAMKAEGLTILPGAGNVEATGQAVPLGLAFDNDPHATHIPSRLQTLKLVRPGRSTR